MKISNIMIWEIKRQIQKVENHRSYRKNKLDKVEETSSFKNCIIFQRKI